MTSYRVQWKSSAIKDLRRLPKKAIAKILEQVAGLADNPYPVGIRKLTGTDGFYRVRSGDYRIVYQVFESILVVQVIRVAHRKDVYR